MGAIEHVFISHMSEEEIAEVCARIPPNMLAALLVLSEGSGEPCDRRLLQALGIPPKAPPGLKLV